MKDRTWGDIPVPNIYKELKGEFVEFIEEEENLYVVFLFRINTSTQWTQLLVALLIHGWM